MVRMGNKLEVNSCSAKWWARETAIIARNLVIVYLFMRMAPAPVSDDSQIMETIQRYESLRFKSFFLGAFLFYVLLAYYTGLRRFWLDVILASVGFIVFFWMLSFFIRDVSA